MLVIKPLITIYNPFIALYIFFDLLIFDFFFFGFPLQETPYVMLKKVQSGVEFENNNDRYEGYCVDLLKLLAQRINFNYELNPIKSRIYGTDNGKGEWDGLIGELMNKVEQY